MTISINHLTRVITIPQADLTFISTGLYELDVNNFRLWLKELEDDSDGIQLPDTHRHNTQVSLGGVTLARTFEIINGYTVTFEDGQYAVRLTGGNNNLADVMNVNQVSLRSNNSAGMIVTGAGDPNEVADAVFAKAIESGLTFQSAIRLTTAVLMGKLSGAGTAEVTIRDTNDTKDRVVATVDSVGNRSNVTLDPS